MTSKRTDATAGPDDVWKAPSASTPRPVAPSVPPMPPPTGPLLAPPSAADKRQGARRTLGIVAIVVGCLVALGVVFAIVAAPVFDAQRAKAADTEAKADVATLGKGIATYFVENDGPPPDITVIDGRYHLDVATSYYQENDTPVAPGVRFGGVSGTGATDWCVWVTNPNGDLKDFQYSAVLGLEPGHC